MPAFIGCVSKFVSFQKFPKMQMRDTVVVAVQKHWREGNHVLGIVVRNSMQVAKFALAGLFISHDEGHLNVAATTAGRICHLSAQQIYDNHLL